MMRAYNNGRFNRVAAIALCCALGGVAGSSLIPLVHEAHAQDPNGERVRLENDMRRLALRNAWAGVERKYDELLALGIDLPFETHQLGAQSARYLGKTLEVYERLTRAQSVQPSDDVAMELGAIESSFGRVELKGSERYLVPVKAKIPPFATDQRKSVEWAAKVMTNTGSFSGMLPLGEYSVGCQTFTVEAGAAPLEVMVKKPKKSEMAACLGIEEGSSDATAGGSTDAPRVEDYQQGVVAYHGPIATIGLNYMINQAPGSPVYRTDDRPDLLQTQGQTSSGAGLSAEVGYEIGFAGANKTFGVMGAVGYGGMFSGSTQQADQPVRFDGATIRAGATIRPGSLRITVGPSWTLMYGKGQGVACWFELDPNADATWDDPPADEVGMCSRPSNPQYEPNAIEWKGWSAAPGAVATVGLAPFTISENEEGKGLQGVIELGGYWSNDGARTIVGGNVRVGIVPHIKRFQQ